MSKYQYTYICSWGSRASQVLYYADGTKSGDPKNVKQPDAVGQVTVAGDAPSRRWLPNNDVEGQLFICDLQSSKLGGNYTVYWMIDQDARSAKTNERVGRAVAVQQSTGSPTYTVVPVWAADGADMGDDQRVKRRRLYYFQNNYWEGRSML